MTKEEKPLTYRSRVKGKRLNKTFKDEEFRILTYPDEELVLNVNNKKGKFAFMVFHEFGGYQPVIHIITVKTRAFKEKKKGD